LYRQSYISFIFHHLRQTDIASILHFSHLVLSFIYLHPRNLSICRWETNVPLIFTDRRKIDNSLMSRSSIVYKCFG